MSVSLTSPAVVSSVSCTGHQAQQHSVRSSPHACGHRGQGSTLMHRETFGQALRRLRGSRSVRDVAQLASCGKSYVCDLENGKRWPTPEIAAALDQALGADGELTALAEA